MSYKQITENLRIKDFNKNEFVELVMFDSNFREYMVKELLVSKDIMLYYHSYYVLDVATKVNGEKLYKYWNVFEELLQDENSYKRDIGITLIANLVEVDDDNRFENIYEKYIARINDEKFMTAQCCVRSLKQIIPNQKFRDRIINDFLLVHEKTVFNRKQMELLKYDILVAFDIVYLEASEVQRVIMKEYMDECTNSISPKTKRFAKKLIKKYVNQL